MKNKKQLRNQRRQERKNLYKRNKKNKKEKHLPDLLVEKETQNINTQGNFIKILKNRIVKIIGLILCRLGFHQKTLQSGLEGTPKYLCRRCLKGSKEKW